MEQIYKEHMVYDFPKEELKPTALIEKLMDEGWYRVFGYFQEEKLAAYAFLVCESPVTEHKTEESVKKIYLLDYFAVCRTGRGQGTGSSFLNELYEVLHPEILIFEVEDPEISKDQGEKEIRIRRMDFYHKNQVKDTGLSTRQFGVDLKILYWSDRWSEDAAEEKIFTALDGIYSHVFGEKYEKGEVAFTAHGKF